MTRRFLALGDSYTIGEGVAESGRWPMQLAAALSADGLALASPEIIAVTGWTTDELDAAITSVAPQGSYALVTLSIGVNNQFRGRSLVEYETQFSALLMRAAGFAERVAERVLVLSIPDWSVTPFAEGRDRASIAFEIDAFNAAARDIVWEAGAVWVDVTGISREPHDGWLAADGLHPSAEQYAQWAARALPLARRAIAP
ncbi:MAG: SGNH/GDSL hydrolase family protein [Gemmatimonadetes bacterium]|nr:SGNH/GDSL hydrolase family protein [Gemmatimonadota bacterium]